MADHPEAWRERLAKLKATPGALDKVLDQIQELEAESQAARARGDEDGARQSLDTAVGLRSHYGLYEQAPDDED